MARINESITVAAGTPLNLATAMTSAQMVTKGYGYLPQKPVSQLFIQMKTGGTGRGYVMTGIRGQTSATQLWRVPDAAVSGDLTAELAPATATAPGGSYSDQPVDGSVDLSQCWVDGSHTGDVITVSYNTKT